MWSKQNRWKLLLSSLVLLSPVISGLLLWDRFPAVMSTHWGADGSADGTGSRAFAVLGLPVLLLAAHLLTVFLVEKENAGKGQDRKVLDMIWWIMPAVSVFSCFMVQSGSLGMKVSPFVFLILFMSFLFAVLGNYLPKTKRNRTVGIKIRWTLANDENWRMTHRFAGKVWFFTGLLLPVLVFLPVGAASSLLGAAFFVLILAPVLYSFVYYKKQRSGGTWTEDSTLSRSGKAGTIAGVFALLVVLASVFLLFSGDIRTDFQEKSFTLRPSYWQSLTVDYDAVTEIVLRTDVEPGYRTHGFGSARLSLGLFENEEFGQYTRYAYTGCKSAAVIRSGEKILVISGKDDAETRKICEELSGRTGCPVTVP